MPGRSWRVGESCGDGEPEGRDRPLEKGVGGIDSGARSVRVWDRVPMKNMGGGIDIGASEKENEFSFSLSFHYICKLK